MKTEVTEGPQLAETLRVLREELARLAERVAALESGRDGLVAVGVPAVPAVPPNGAAAGTAVASPPAPAPTPAAAKAAPAAVKGVSDEVLVVISAAIAAFLGKKPRIRQVRLITSSQWSTQGRVNIQASHAFGHHPRSGASS